MRCGEEQGWGGGRRGGGEMGSRPGEGYGGGGGDQLGSRPEGGGVEWEIRWGPDQRDGGLTGPIGQLTVG